MFCAETGIDIVILSFVTESPDMTGDGYPGTNFGSGCGGNYPNPSGTGTSDLLGPCSAMADGIQACHNNGKKVMLSLGGGAASGFYIASDTSAETFAQFLWGAFGPPSSTWTGPRPFNDQFVDGFDFDIESTSVPAGASIDGEYDALANDLRTLYATSSARTVFLECGTTMCRTGQKPCQSSQQCSIRLDICSIL